MTRFSSVTDGSPTPAWVEDLRRREAAQRQAAYRMAERSAPAEKRKPKRDWLAPSPWRIP